MKRPVLRSERIELHPMTVQHLPLLHRLDADHEVMRHLTGRARTPDEIDAHWRPRCEDVSADAHGLGFWVGFHADDFLGWWVLSPDDAGQVSRPVAASIGWRLARRHWGHGLATEGARTLLGHALNTVALRRVWAETMAVNARSRSVMHKLGMRHTGTEVLDWEDPLPGSDEGEVRYEITREEWRAHAPS